MKRISTIIAIFALAALVLASTCSAQLTEVETFILAATITPATGITIEAFKVDSQSGIAESMQGATALPFDPMIPNPETGVWLPNHYYYVNVVPSGGAGNPTTTIKYTEGNNPNGVNGHGLGWKGNAGFTAVTYPAGQENVVPLANHLPKLLKDMVGTGEVVQASELTGHLRFYLGINDGSTSPTGGEVFSNADAPGPYTGVIFVSATVS